MKPENQISPFQFGTLASGATFIDRVADRALLRQLLGSHINTMLVSPRRWGKSSLVRVALSEMQAADPLLRVCYIDAFAITSEAEFYRVFASRVIACAETRMERWADDARRFLTSVVPRLVVTDQVTDFLAFDLRFQPQPQEKTAILELPQTIAQAKGVHIIVCIDEFQQLANLPQYADMAGKMRAVWQQQHDVAYCLYGSKRSMMLRIFNNAQSPFYRFGQVVFLQKIAQADWVQHITEAFQRTGRSITPEQAEQVCRDVDCHTWYVQQLCFFLWTATTGAVTDELLRDALQQVVDINTPMFQSDVERLTTSQRALLRAVANGTQHLTGRDAVAVYNLGNPNTIARNKRALLELDLVETQTDGTLAITDPLFARWIRLQQ